ncbi:nitrilase-related carbon-nitrogen hydrolase [Telluribacter sp. SYSU D00476]|uniref:nitrilase-related carbon-nitrogen hydrolase n=1 Tax=Telluribacter sp. SYSU D00476 TaxID=2811430 RepID=UPI001FF53B80|nr:nitrilase-related carbon-nitrogen hydrolase [Telluribacter sp. SYSU D00476]
MSNFLSTLTTRIKNNLLVSYSGKAVSRQGKRQSNHSFMVPEKGVLTPKENLKGPDDRVGIVLAALFSGLCFFLGNGLSGDFWYLVWIAPIPVLIKSWTESEKTTFRMAFMASLLGRLSWFWYLKAATSLPLAIVFTLALSYVFAQIVVYSWRAARKLHVILAVLTYPVLQTAFECLLINFSPDGSATSIAYTQANVLPLIQMASVTGITGITFLVSLIPSTIAVSWCLRERAKHSIPFLLGTSLMLVGVTVAFGLFQIAEQVPGRQIKVGLVVLDKKLHRRSQQATVEQAESHVDRYSKAISALALQGTQVVVLPEGAFQTGQESYEPVLARLRTVAQKYKIYLIAGVAYFGSADAYNKALIFDPEGNIATDYVKNHLVRGHERAFTTGKEIGIFQLFLKKGGIAICKDLDFPTYIRTYGRQEADVLFVPALDFIVDDWLHSRMALLRGVEIGVPIVRTALAGRLTISDATGRVLYEANSSHGRQTALFGIVPLHRRTTTLYTTFGDWFGYLALLAAVYIILAVRTKKIAIAKAGQLSHRIL